MYLKNSRKLTFKLQSGLSQSTKVDSKLECSSTNLKSKPAELFDEFSKINLVIKIERLSIQSLRVSNKKDIPPLNILIIVKLRKKNTTKVRKLKKVIKVIKLTNKKNYFFPVFPLHISFYFHLS